MTKELFIDIANNKVLLILLGAFITYIVTKFSAKTGVLKYFITANKLGTSADDQVFGSVRLTWQGHEVRNLHLCTIEVENSTTRDFENVQFRVYTAKETILLNQRTEVVGTPYIVNWEEKYQTRIHVPAGQTATQIQIDEYNHNREYNVPVLNRGQVIRFSYLCTNPNDDNVPGVFISTPSKSIKLKQQHLRNFEISPIFGAPVAAALTRAIIISALTVIATGLWITNIWLGAIVCMFVGLTGQILGALAYKIERVIINSVAG